MSTAVMRALLGFLDKAKLHLCEEFIWYNPARLPSPAVWVNIERWLGDHWLIRTKRYDEDIEHVVEIDVNIIAKGNLDLPYRTVSVPDKHSPLHYNRDLIPPP